MRGSAKGPGDGRAERPQPRHLPAGPQGTLRWLPSPRPPGRGATALQTGLESHSGRTAPSKRGLGPVGGTRGSRHVLLGGTLTSGLRPRPPGGPNSWPHTAAQAPGAPSRKAPSSQVESPRSPLTPATKPAPEAMCRPAQETERGPTAALGQPRAPVLIPHQQTGLVVVDTL